MPDDKPTLEYGRRTPKPFVTRGDLWKIIVLAVAIVVAIIYVDRYIPDH